MKRKVQYTYIVRGSRKDAEFYYRYSGYKRSFYAHLKFDSKTRGGSWGIWDEVELYRFRNGVGPVEYLEKWSKP